jgi:hypothetical protein
MNNSGLPPEESGEINITSLPRKSSTPHPRESTRRVVAYWLLAMISVIALIISGGVVAGRLSIEEAKDMALILYAPIVGVFGIVIGFFFGEERD